MTAVAGGVAGSAAAAIGTGTLLWNRATARAVAQLAPGGTAGTFTRDQLAGLPAPVVRYFEFALTLDQQRDQPLIRTARIEHEGEFRGSLDAPWSPFKSVQHFSVDPPGFVWDAAIRMGPLMTVRVRDSYLEGNGSMRASVAGLIPVVNAWGRTDLASGALHRYLAESVWLPTALLPGAGVTWEPIDDNAARATLSDSGVSVSLDFRFNEKGEVVSVYTPGRYRDVNGKGVQTPWEGQFRGYERMKSVMVPREGEVAWILPEGRLTYWRGRVVRIECIRKEVRGCIEGRSTGEVTIKAPDDVDDVGAER
ncbi:MAG: hypothetical protein QOH06_4535 [Acidobacteriota bacterium]|jgi:hypothetical protein|nr:hypothetical protein [Acidobacteriota bacterium]